MQKKRIKFAGHYSDY